MVDVITVGETMVALVPKEQGTLRYVQNFTKKTAGAESNVAIGMAKLGHSVGWISKLGQDEFGEFILREIRGENVDASRVVRSSDHATGIMFKQHNPVGETSVVYYRQHSAASTMSPEDIDIEYLKQTRIVHISGVTSALSDSCAETVQHIVQLCKINNIIFSFDPNIRLKLWTEKQAKQVLLPLLNQCDIALIGQDEGKVLLGTTDPNEMVHMLRGMGVQKMAIKMGSKGALVADAIHSHSIPIVPMPVIDNIGAGDAFNSGFLCGILEDKPIDVCGKMGAVMGAFAVSTYGDTEGLPFRPEFDRVLTQSETVYR